MAKLPRNYRISTEVDQLLKFESARLTEEQGKKVSEADVIELAVVRWCSVDDVNTAVNTEPEKADALDRRSVAEIAMREAESKPPTEDSKPRKRAESVAERRAREAKEHAAKLAEADTLAREAGRDDIEYDLENVPHRSVLHVATQSATPMPAASYEIKPREAKPLTRPHGSTEAKRRRDQS